MTDLQAVLFGVQILFYIVTGTVVVLTYRNAKRGLLSPVHTEYQKHVIERLKELSGELDTEFDPLSKNYWAADSSPMVDDAMRTQVDQINEEFRKREEEILAKGEWEPATHGHSRRYHGTRLLARSIKTDPFLPPTIRKICTEFLNARAKAIYDAEEEAPNSYRRALAEGGPLVGPDTHYAAVNNTIVTILVQKGSNVDQVEEKVEKIRLAIQEYLTSYAPNR